MNTYTPLQRVEQFDELITAAVNARASFLKSYADQGQNAYTSPDIIEIGAEDEVSPDLVCATSYSNGGTTCLVGYCTASVTYGVSCPMGMNYCTMGFSTGG